MSLNTEIDDTEDEFYDFQLIEFVTRGSKGHRKVDIVPSTWPKYNAQKGRMESPFLPPPYTQETSEMLTHFVQNKLAPLQSWPVYTVKLVGRAKTFVNGTRKLLLLENTDNVVYTADSDFNPQEKADYLKNKYKERVKQGAFSKIPLPKNSTLSSSSSSDDTDSSWEKKELKSLLDSAKTKSAKFQKKATKKDSKSKSKGVMKPSKQNKKDSRTHAVDKPQESDSLQRKQTLCQNDPPFVEKQIKQKNSELKKIKSQDFCPAESRKADAALIETFGSSEAFNQQFESLQNSVEDLLNASKRNISSEEVASDSLANNTNDHGKDFNGNEEIGSDSLANNTNDHGKDFSGNNHKAVDHDQLKAQRKAGKKHTKEDAHRKKVEGSSLLTYTKRHKDKFRVKSGRIRSDTQLILAAIKGVSVTQQEILDRQEHQEEMIRALFKKLGLMPNPKSFIASNNLQLPFQEISELEDFDNKLEGEPFRNEFISSLHCLMDKDLNISRSVLNVLKKYFSKNLASQFTNVRRMPNKLLLKDYKMHQCILDAVIETHGSIIGEGAKSNFLEKSASDAIGTVLSNVRDWYKGRRERQAATSQLHEKNVLC